MKKCIDVVAIGLVLHDGVAYADGEVIADMPAKQAEALLRVGAARLADVKAESKQTADKQPAGDDDTTPVNDGADKVDDGDNTPPAADAANAEGAAVAHDAAQKPVDDSAAKAAANATGGKATGGKKAN